MKLQYQTKAIMYSIFVIALTVLSPYEALSQTYSKLSPNSDLYCIYLPSGKTQIAYGNNDTYRKTGFKNATKRSAKKLSQQRKNAKKINQIIKKLKKQQSSGELTIKLKPKEFKTVRNFYLKGELGEVPESISENISRLEVLREKYFDNIRFETELIKLIKRCKKRVIPSPGTLSTLFYNVTTSPYNQERDISGSGYTLVLAIVPAHIATRTSYLCYDHPRQGTRYRIATTDPCLAAGISNFHTEDCARIVDRDAKGRPQFYLAELEIRNFHFQNKPGGRTFDEAASANETRLRTGDIYGWGDSVSYAVVSNADACNSEAF